MPDVLRSVLSECVNVTTQNVAIPAKVRLRRLSAEGLREFCGGNHETNHYHIGAIGAPVADGRLGRRN